MSKKNYRAGPNLIKRKPHALTERFQFVMTMETRENLINIATLRGMQPSELLRNWIDSAAKQTELPL